MNPTDLTPDQRRTRLAALARADKRFAVDCERRMREGGSMPDRYELVDGVSMTPQYGSVMPSERFYGRSRK